MHNPCNDWNNNKSVNPLTKRKIKPSSQMYKALMKACENPQRTCKQFNENVNVNPITNKNLSENSKIKIFLKLFCAQETTPAKKNAQIAKIEEVCQFPLKNSPAQCTMYDTVTLKEHQKKVCNFVVKNTTKGLILFHSVGSGKTITAITIIRCMLRIYPDKKVFIVTPKSLVDNFAKEMRTLQVHFGDQVKVYSKGTFVRKIKDYGAKFCQDAMLVVDEAHNFKTENGQDVRQLMKATSIASHVFLLTATPAQNRPTEIANLYAMITKKEKEVAQVRKALEEGPRSKLYRMFHNKISYFKNNDTTEYPSVSYHNVSFRMTPEYYNLYMHIENNESEKFRDLFSGSNLKVFYNGIRRAVNFVDSNVTTPKIEWAIQHITKNVQNNKKTLLYSNWIAAGSKLVQDRLDQKDIRWAEVNGSLSSNKRKAAVSAFNSGKTKVLFISSAGSEGLDLKGTNSVIVLEPHWNNEKIKQVVGRAVRYKSHSHLPPNKRHVDVYNLVLQKPARKNDKLAAADEYLLEISNKKDIELDQFYNILMDASI